MAKFYPADYKKLKVSPTKWELFLLKKLEELSDEYEIFFNAYLNTLRPDIVILRKWYWVLVIEVKDWDIKNYNVTNPEYWEWNFETWKWVLLPSPLKQVMQYQNEFCDIYISWLLEKRLENKMKTYKDTVFWMIETWIFLYNATYDDIHKMNISKIWSNYKSVKILNKEFGIKYYEINKKNIFFTEDIYNEFKRFLQPNSFIKEQIEWFEYKPEQKRLIISKDWEQKISWFPWSGKTVVLAWRAKNAIDRHDWRVLILTYNITLRKYIEQKLKNIWANLNKIIITNYHNFTTSYLKQNKIGKIDINNDYENLNLFKNNTNKFETIFIDEIQDYKQEWIDIIKNFFLKDNWEFVVFWDIKQDIYNRQSWNKEINTRVVWAWNKLTTSFRVENDIWKLANEFQKFFFNWHYEYDEIPTKQLSFDFSKEKESYINYINILEQDFSKEIFNIFNDVVKKLAIHEDDVCILWTEKEEMRELDFYFRKNRKKTISTFETKEIFEVIWNNKDELDKIERYKKFHFYPHPWVLKISTIHSFKWWESKTVFLIIDNKCDNNELIYTWITRTKDNLIIINLWNKKYDDFFNKYK